MIIKFIKDTVIEHRGYNCWLSRKYIITEKLQQLQPDKPEDGDTGKIAFNVPNKDRMKIKTGRFLTRKLNLNNGFLPDAAIREITDKINTLLFPDIKIEIVSGIELTEHYYQKTGGHSCMVGTNSEYTRLYERNPDKIRMLIMHYNSDSARGIVWKLDNGRYFLDRVYATCENLKEKMADYASEHNWLRKTLPVYDLSDLIVSNLTYHNGEIPYMDTLTCGCTCSTGLTVSVSGCEDYNLENQDGELQSGYICECCGERVNEDEHCSTDDGVYCESCFNENFTYCEQCGETVSTDDIVRIEDTEEYFCSYCVNMKAHKCEDCGGYYKNECAEIEGDIYCDSCAENYARCRDCGEQFIDSDCINEDGLCEDCRPEPVTVSCQALHLSAEYPGQRIFDYGDMIC